MPQTDPNKFIRHTDEYYPEQAVEDRATIVDVRKTTPEEGFKAYVTGAAEGTAARTAYEAGGWAKASAIKNDARDHKNPFAKAKKK